MSKTMTNVKRELTDIANEIHALERRSIFDIGKLLIEARDTCEHGEWGDWLDNEFDWSHDTAENYMAAAHLAAKFRTVRDLKVPARIIYSLGEDIDDPNLPAIIEALALASEAKPISVAAAKEIIHLTELRIEHGDYPEATLLALDHLSTDLDEWAKQAAESLKTAKPTTNEEAKRIVHAHYRSHVEALYHSPLPDWIETEMLDLLENATDYKRVLDKLNAAPAPLAFEQVLDIVFDHDDKGADEPPPSPAPKPPAPRPPRPKSETKETDPEQAAAAAEVRSDIGPLSQAEHERLETVIADLTNQTNVLKTSISGRDNEIARLESEIKTLRGADPPTLTVNKHLDALIALLKKQSREGQEVAVERLCNALKIDPRKINIETEAA
jgi:Protein of unknown function (DUF3102)